MTTPLRMADSCELDDDVDFDASWDDLFLDSSDPSSKANAVNTTSRHKDSPNRSTTTAKEDNVVSASPTKSPAAYQPSAHSNAPSSSHKADADHLDLWPSLSTTTATSMTEGSGRATNAVLTKVDSFSPRQSTSTRRTIDSFSQIARRKVTSARFTDIERLPSAPPTEPPTWPSPGPVEARGTTQSSPCVDPPATAIEVVLDLSETNDVVTELDEESATCSRRQEERDSPRVVIPTSRRASTNPFDDDSHAAHVDTSDEKDAVEQATLLQPATPPKKPTLLPPMTLDQEQARVSADDDEVSWKQFVMDEALMSSVKESMELETSQVSMDLHDENNSSPELTPRRVDATPGKISLEESKRQDLWHTLRQGSIAIAPIKRNATIAAMEPSVVPIEIAPPPPPSLTLLHTLDQKLASFESYLGENKALKTDLDKANQTIAVQETHIKALERDAHAFQQTIHALQRQLEAARATQQAQSQAAHDVATYAAKCLRWETFALMQHQRRDHLQILSTVWRAWLTSRHGGRTAKLRAAARFAHFAATRRAAQQDLRQALHHLRHANALQVGTHEAKQARRMSLEYRRHTRETAVRCALLLIAGCWRRHEQHALHHAFCHWKSTDQATKAKRNALDRGCAMLQTWHSFFWTAKKRLALVRWRHYMTTASDFALVASAAMQKDDFEQAKACIFDLTKTTSQLREANATLSIQVATHHETLHQLRTELQLTKHGFVATTLRRLDIESARGWFHAWRESIHVEKATKSMQATVCELEMKLEERDRFTKSLDAYNKVLQADLDRFQYVTQDTRLAVDVLTKKLLREEAKSVALAADRAALDAQLQALCWIDGVPGETDDDNQPLECPLEVLHVSKAWMIDRLAQVFAIHADKVVQDKANAAPVYVMSWENCFELVQSTLSHASSSTPPPPPTGVTAGNESNQTNLSDGMDMLSQLESFFPPPPITFRAFMTGVAAFLTHMHGQSTDETVRASVANFWRALLDSTGNDSTVSTAAAVASATSWTRKNQLSDEILQNQEKLLAVLEHETAVVERAVLDKASLKHTYSSDPLAALEMPQPPPQTPVLVDCNWLDLPQVRDLILSYEMPLAQLYAKYAVNHPALLPPPQNAFERHLDAVRERAMAAVTAHVALTLQGVLKLFEDLKLFPTVFPPEVVARLFIDVANATDSSTSSSPTLSFPGFIKLFGSCILTTFESHSTPVAMSIRERLDTFLSDVHCLTTTTVRPAKPCVVGQELEAILWPLFEYYSSGGGSNDRLDETRLTMTSMKFCRFMHEIAGMDKERGRANAELMFRKAVRVSRGTSLASRMVFDEFYMGIYYMHQLRDSTKRDDNPGDALREWMQQL